MAEKQFGNLLPTEDDIRNILSQVMQTDPRQIPVAMLQIWFGHHMLRIFNRLEDEVDKSVEEFKSELEKAIKRLEDKAGL
jgi:ribosomal protein S24E